MARKCSLLQLNVELASLERHQAQLMSEKINIESQISGHSQAIVELHQSNPGYEESIRQVPSKFDKIGAAIVSNGYKNENLNHAINQGKFFIGSQSILIHEA